MLSIQSAMLIALGLSIAGLFICLFAPLYSRRAARLAIASLKKNMPTTSEEIQAEQDRIRAQYALEIHDLQSRLSALLLKEAHQLVEISKTNGHIQTLEKEISHLKSSNEEHQNARRVLEVTITDRIPKIEQRLSEAKKLLFDRDHEITALTQSAQKQARALQEASQINTQQRAEIESLNLRLSRRSQRTSDNTHGKNSEVETALRTENETLRTRLREQAQTLILLQKKLASEAIPAENQNPESEMKRLSRILAEAEKAFQATQSKNTNNVSLEETLQKQITALKVQNAEQVSIIESLKTEINNKNKKFSQHVVSERTERDETDFISLEQPILSSFWKEEGSPMPSGQPSLTELINAPRTVNSEWKEYIPLDQSLSENQDLSEEELESKKPSRSYDKPKGEDRQEEAKKSSPKSSLLQRITNLEKSAT